jgi:hypothetical protein
VSTFGDARRVTDTIVSEVALWLANANVAALDGAGPRIPVKVLTHEGQRPMMTAGLARRDRAHQSLVTRVSAEGSHGADRRIDFHL